MGTNYYYRYDICGHCQRYKERHIGKSSYGWKFLFKAYVEHWDRPIIKSIDDLVIFIQKNPGKIFDEYNVECSLEDFWGMVESKQKEKHTINDDREFISHGYYFCSSEFS